jgi:hypothetical protein
MLNLKNAHGLTAAGNDGEAGRVHEILFNSQTLNVEYIVVNTEGRLNKKLVLVKPANVDSLDEADKKINLNMSVEEISEADSIESIKDLYEPADKYAWPYYWLGTGGGFPGVTPSSVFQVAPVTRFAGTNPKLVSSRSISGFKIITSDAYKYKIRKVFLDENSLNIKYLDISPVFSLTALKSILVKVNSILGFSINREVINLVNTFSEIKSSNASAHKYHIGFTFNYKNRLQPYSAAGRNNG